MYYMLPADINCWTCLLNVLCDFMDPLEGGSKLHSLGPI